MNLLFVSLLLLIEGVFSGCEIALLSADRLELRKMSRGKSLRARGSRIALHLLGSPERVFSTTILMTNLCVIGISSVITFLVLDRFGEHAEHVEPIAVLISSALVVILGELVPKTLFQKSALVAAPWAGYLVGGAYWVLWPLTRSLSAYTKRISRSAVPVEQLITGRKRTTREEIRAALSYGKTDSGLKGADKRMIRRILDFKESSAKHALIPLIHVDAIEDTATVAEALAVFRRHRHSRLPVYHERMVNIIGILEVLPLLKVKDRSQPIRPFLKSAEYIAEVQTLEDVLIEMQRRNSQFMTVVDEHGGAVGILTFEDIVEEIVGEIQDEYDREPPPLRPLGENRWLVQAKIDIEKVNELLHLELPKGEYETLGGYLLLQFGRIPAAGDELMITTAAGNLRFEVQRGNKRRIETVVVELVSSES